MQIETVSINYIDKKGSAKSLKLQIQQDENIRVFTSTIWSGNSGKSNISLVTIFKEFMNDMEEVESITYNTHVKQIKFYGK